MRKRRVLVCHRRSKKASMVSAGNEDSTSAAG